MGKEIADKMREAGKVQADPAIAAIQDLSESVATSFEVLERDQEKGREEAQATSTEIRQDVEKTRTEMAAGFKVHADKIDALDRRSVAVGYGSFRDVEGCCLAALGPEEKQDIAAVALMMPKNQRDREERPIFSNAASSTLVAHWLLASTLIQKRRFASKQEETALYERLERYEKAIHDAFRTEKAAALLTTTETLGGHWLPEPVAAELYRLVLDNSVIGQLATHVPMQTKTLDLPVEGSSALSVSWGSENTNITDSVPASNALNKVTLTASRLNGFAQSSMEELQDSAVSILSWVRDKLVELAGREIDLQALEGSGSPFTGIIGDAGVNEIVSGTNGDAVTYQFLVDTVFKARERASREAARFFASPEMMAKIVGLVDDNGMPVVQFGNVPNKFAASILGFPVEIHSVISAARTWGTGTTLSHLYFGPARSIVIGDRVGMAWDTSDAVGFQAYQLAMRLVMRLAIGIAVPKAWTRRLNLDV